MVTAVPETRDVFPDLTVEAEPSTRRIHTPPRPEAGVLRDRETHSSPTVSPFLPERQTPAGRKPVRRRTADARDCPGADVAGRRVLLLDEPSLGLAPLIVDQIFDMILRLKGLRPDDSPGGAECGKGARRQRPGLRHAARPYRGGGAGFGDSQPQRSSSRSTWVADP